jgi:(4-(4-[2-(gamma-L-glutamylamino)ethyl]phenoxymethyl)furan-2-yl)methanamine synthase
VLGGALRFYAADEAGRPWLSAEQARVGWRAVASANWHASAALVARRLESALLIDIGSTTTDLIPVRGHEVVAQGRDDASRLATGELVYQGVVRTPLCVLARKIEFAGRPHGVMNEWFATSADVYRLTGELDEAHDQQAAADQGEKTAVASARRVARLIGRDAHEAPLQQWRDFALQWRARQLAAINGELQRVLAERGLPADAPLVAAGCGAFLVPALAAARGRPVLSFDTLCSIESDQCSWVRVCAPAAALALLAGTSVSTEGDSCGW